MHCYLYVDCKTPGCKSRVLVGHSEWPSDDPRSIEYADEYFPLSVPCGSCNRTHLYHANEIGSFSSPAPQHPAAWRPILPRPKDSLEPEPSDIKPGHWYVCAPCTRCKKPIPFFEIMKDAPMGGDGTFAFQNTPCPFCGHVDYYPASEWIRLQAQSEPKS
jgi:hypothetical protein